MRINPQAEKVLKSARDAIRQFDCPVRSITILAVNAHGEVVLWQDSDDFDQLVCVNALADNLLKRIGGAYLST